MPGQSKGAGDQAQIASKQRISQGKGHEPSCCAFQGGTSPVSNNFLLGLYGEHILPATLYSYTQVLRALELYTTPDSPLVPDAMPRGVWTRLRARLSSLDASSTMIEVTPAFATHFIDMYVDKHTGKHMTGEKVRILLLSLPFLLRDLIAPEVCDHKHDFCLIMICV